MRRFAPLLLLVLAACTGEAAAPPAGPPPAPMPEIMGWTQQTFVAWVQLGANGTAELRAVTGATSCPDAELDGQSRPMAVRAASTGEFPLTCALALPPGARQAVVNGRALSLPVADPQRILVLGDTGCRLKGSAVQACNDPGQWPFPGLAAAAAGLKPDLVIHVGDYLYRESACPEGNAGCAGTPHGDNWPTWDADFFGPAAPLLAAAPWIIVRGNHEDCARAGAGWERLLGPNAFDAAQPCSDHLPAYAVPFARLNIVVMDDADAPDTSVDAAEVPTYRKELADLAAQPRPSWLVLHRPIWAAVTGPFGLPVGGNATLIGAVGRSGIARPVELMLAGHIHSFEALNYRRRVPPQIVAGNGGDNLDVTPRDLAGTIFQGHSGVSVKDGVSVGGFGFLLMTRSGSGWDIRLYDQDGRPGRLCRFEARRVDCSEPGT